MAEEEHEPLWPVGRHVVSLDEVVTRCVAKFPESLTRPAIAVGLVRVITVLEWAGASGEIWVDGSFVTDKADPNDADIIFRMAALDFDRGSMDLRSAVEFVDSNLRSTHRCDSYVLYEWPADHPNFWRGEYMYAYWLRQWGFDRQSTMKGIPVIQVGGGFHV